MITTIILSNCSVTIISFQVQHTPVGSNMLGSGAARVCELFAVGGCCGGLIIVGGGGGVGKMLAD
jgi:hypothetical protein